MTRGKRIMDLLILAVFLPMATPIALIVAGLLLIGQGRPVLHLSERMCTPDRAFALWKFRTMHPDPGDGGVTGRDKAGRITPLGAVLRRLRLDELPQLWNVLRGDMTLVGPRPPLRRYVERFPQIYGPVLLCRPGITGLATLAFHRREAQLLSACETAAETETVYVRRCIPVKARLDTIYRDRRTAALDLLILMRTIRSLFPAWWGRG